MRTFVLLINNRKPFSLSPDGSGNPVVPGFGTTDCNEQRERHL
jgi:hypothetical protein